MNIAIAAIAVFFIILPGVIFTHSYRLTDGEKSYTAFSKISIMAIITSALFHLFMVALLELFNQPINYQALFDFLDGKTLTKESVDVFNHNRWLIAGYFITLYIKASLLGRLANTIVIRYGFDIKYPFLCLGSHWYTAFRARIKAARPYLIKNPDSVLVIMDALVTVSGEVWIYTGVVDRFIEKGNGELDVIILTQAVRQRFDTQKDTFGARYEIPSTYLYLKYNEINNYNLIYSYLDKNENWVLIDV
ncbi:MAG: hypothetical protein AAGB12_09170 [Pseudomonadota bacterium]